MRGVAWRWVCIVHHEARDSVRVVTAAPETFSLRIEHLE